MLPNQGWCSKKFPTSTGSKWLFLFRPAQTQRDVYKQAARRHEGGAQLIAKEMKQRNRLRNLKNHTAMNWVSIWKLNQFVVWVAPWWKPVNCIFCSNLTNHILWNLYRRRRFTYIYMSAIGHFFLPLQLPYLPPVSPYRTQDVTEFEITNLPSLTETSILNKRCGIYRKIRSSEHSSCCGIVRYQWAQHSAVLYAKTAISQQHHYRLQRFIQKQSRLCDK